MMIGRRLLQVVILVLMPAGILAAEPRTNPHLKDESGKTLSCDGCHKPHKAASGEAALPLLDDTEIKLCQRCHPAGNDHPVDMIPKRVSVPKDLPLNKEGKVVCSTCHDSHGTTKFPKLLRANSQLLCTMCHADR